MCYLKRHEKGSNQSVEAAEIGGTFCGWHDGADGGAAGARHANSFAADLISFTAALLYFPFDYGIEQ